jgi:hypothetical protein
MTAGVKRFRFKELVFCKLRPTASMGLVIAWRAEEKSSIVQAFLDLVRSHKADIRRSAANPG